MKDGLKVCLKMYPPANCQYPDGSNTQSDADGNDDDDGRCQTCPG